MLARILHALAHVMAHLHHIWLIRASCSHYMAFQANEHRDGYATNGEYRVALPDGRTQIVTYNVADAYGGYVADVKYEGVAQYPEVKPYHPAKPAPYHA